MELILTTTQQVYRELGVFATFAWSEFQIGLAFLSVIIMLAGVEGGVMYVQNSNSSVSTTSEDSQFSFNSAVERGGVISMNGSSLDIWYSHIFNNSLSADLGAVVSACSSGVNFPHDILYQYSDPNFPNCLLYDVIENRPSTEAVTAPVCHPSNWN